MKKLLTSCRIGECEIKNRFVMTAANLGWCEDGFITDKVISFYRQRARGQVGMIIVGAAGVDSRRVNTSAMMQVYDDCFIEGLSKLTKAVHEEGSRIFLQLMHAGAYAKSSEHGGQTAVAPSAYHCSFTREDTRALTREEICEIRDEYRAAAGRAKKAGFDGVEILAGTGYLLSEFLSGAVNRRTDEYGGSIQHRTRFLLEIIESVREEVGEHFPICVRISGSDFIPGGNKPDDAVAVAKIISEHVDAINVTGGWHETTVPQITCNVPHGMYLYLAKAVKDAVQVPVIGCNRINLKTAETALNNDYCDMVGICRGFIADPMLVYKYAKGDLASIRPCIACNLGCLERIFAGSELRCVINPYVGREKLPGEVNIRGKNILVIGAGIAGLAYAMLASSENKVTVWEKKDVFGGVGSLVANLPNREDVRDYLNYLYHKCLENGVTFVFGKNAGGREICSLLRKDVYDSCVIATGCSIQKYPPHTAESVHTVTAEQCIEEGIQEAQDIVVLGSGPKAVQTALFCKIQEKQWENRQQFLKRYAPEQMSLAADLMHWKEGNTVLITSGKRVEKGFGRSSRWMVHDELDYWNVTVQTEAQVLSIGKKRVVCEINGCKKSIPADLVVLAEGWEPDRELFNECLKEFPDRVELIGDAVRPGSITNAVMDAYILLTQEL